MDNNTLLMNKHTGSIDTYMNWLCDYHARSEEDHDKSFEEWGSGLVEVERNEI